MVHIDWDHKMEMINIPAWDLLILLGGLRPVSQHFGDCNLWQFRDMIC